MWEKCVGCGEGLFAGDAFCGNCGRPVTPAVPAAREPDGLESAQLSFPATGPAQVRLIPAAHDPDALDQAVPPEALARTGLTAPDYAPAPDDPAQPHVTLRPDTPVQPDRQGSPSGTRYPGSPEHPDGPDHPDGPRLPDVTDRSNGAARHDDPAPGNGASPEDGAPSGDGATPGESAVLLREAVRLQEPASAEESGAAAAGPVQPAATRLSGPANLDPVRNARYLGYVLRQAGVFIGIYLLIETVLLTGLLLSSAAGTKLGPALRLEMDSLWVVALALAILFWLIPVPALLAEWSLLMEQGSAAAPTAFKQINSAFQAHETPLDSQRVRTVSRHHEGSREYLELRRGYFSGYVSCFAHGTDLYVGWTFWLYMSPLRLLVLVIGRNIRDATSRGTAIQRSLRFESARALVAAIHGATLAGIDAASSQTDPAGPQLVRETAIDMNFRLG